MLLRLRLANHRSIKDEAELSLISARFRGAHPAEGTWADVTNRVAGIYGANASGKSTVLDGFRFLATAVRNSASHWADRSAFPYHPFAFDAKSRSSPSLYEIDFTVADVRYAYGFRSGPEGIVEEWLYSYPSARRRILFERQGDGEIRFGRTLPGENVRMARGIRPTQLFLSLAALNNHPALGRIRHEIIGHFLFAQFSEVDQHARLRHVMQLLSDEKTLREAEALLNAADTGIAALKIQDIEPPEAFRETLARFFQIFESEGGPETDNRPEFERLMREYRKQFKFFHAGAAEDPESALTINDESSGTVAWLALAVPALQAVRRGHTFVIDEIDSSLHPRLTASLIHLFKDEQLNRHGAQLIFTTHDTSLLGRLHGDTLGPDEIWLTEKNASGGTELYSVAEFPVRDRDNLERRYMQGRYGAVPMISWQTLRGQLAERDAS